MCGIAGMVGGRAPLDRIDAMTDALRHRGPDDRGVWSAPGVRLGHRRLSIIDLSTAGHQPMTFGPLTIVYNGEIYNYRELRDALPGPFVSHSDTEVLLHLYAREGPRCLDRLQGMFAFAIWDAERRELFAARDRLGIKPFFYSDEPDCFAFASELKALLALQARSVERSALLDYFTYKYVPAPKTIYGGLRKLPPAHHLVYDGTLRLTRYWQPAPRVERRDAVQAAEELDALLADAVRRHTIADVPVGVFLSGGMDSSTLVAYLGTGTRTFTIGFDVAEHSEVEQARQVATHFHTEHREETVGQIDLDGALAALPSIYDEPFGDSSAWATHVVSALARRHVTVALSGEGGDEVFSGYGWYRRWLSLDPSRAAPWAARWLPPFSAAARSLARRDPDELARYAALISVFTTAQKRALLAPDWWQRDYDHLWYLRQHWRPDLDPIKRMQHVDLHTFLPDDLLVKVDRASMACSLEVRPPLLDHRLVEFAVSLDPSLLRDGGTGKRLLRQVIGPRLPASILERPKKGFSMPVRRWVDERPDLLDGALQRLARAGILRSPRRPRLDGEQMWTLLVLDRWMRHAGV